MINFKFRLEKLLEYRRLQEKWAKDAYLEVIVRKFEAEAEIESIKRRRETALRSSPSALDELVSLDAYMTKLDDDQRASETAESVISTEVETALDEWTVTRMQVAAIEKLREAELAEWTLNENRREQSELDEWSSQRRAA